MDGLKSASSFTAGVFVVGGLRGRLVGIFFRLGNDFGGLLGRGVLS